MSELIRRGLHALRRAATWWSVAIVVFVVLNAAFWPSLEGTDVMKGFEEMGSLLEAFGAQDLASPAGYLDGQLYALMLPLLLTGLAVQTTSAITSGDEDAGRLELLQALPVSRRTVWASRWIAATAVLAGAAALGALVMVAFRGPFSLEEVGVGRIAGATAGCALLALFHGGVAFAAGAAGFSRGRAIGVAVFVAVLGYVMSVLLPLSEALDGARQASPWHWALGQQPVSDGVGAGGLLLVVACTAALVALGLVLVERRDIRSA